MSTPALSYQVRAFIVLLDCLIVVINLAYEYDYQVPGIILGKHLCKSTGGAIT